MGDTSLTFHHHLENSQPAGKVVINGPGNILSTSSNPAWMGLCVPCTKSEVMNPPACLSVELPFELGDHVPNPMDVHGCQPKNRGETPKMDGENKGKPY